MGGFRGNGIWNLRTRHCRSSAVHVHLVKAGTNIGSGFRASPRTAVSPFLSWRTPTSPAQSQRSSPFGRPAAASLPLGTLVALLRRILNPETGQVRPMNSAPQSPPHRKASATCVTRRHLLGPGEAGKGGFLVDIPRPPATAVQNAPRRSPTPTPHRQAWFHVRS